MGMIGGGLSGYCWRRDVRGGRLGNAAGSGLAVDREVEVEIG